jgi:hypothetical protein
LQAGKTVGALEAGDLTRDPDPGLHRTGQRFDDIDPIVICPDDHRRWMGRGIGGQLPDHKTVTLTLREDYTEGSPWYAFATREWVGVWCPTGYSPIDRGYDFVYPDWQDVDGERPASKSCRKRGTCTLCVGARRASQQRRMAPSPHD